MRHSKIFSDFVETNKDVPETNVLAKDSWSENNEEYTTYGKKRCGKYFFNVLIHQLFRFMNIALTLIIAISLHL